MGPDLLAVTPAHSELRGQLPQTPRSRLIGFQHLHTQIIRIRLCHHLVFAKIAKPTMTALPFPAYNYCDSALVCLLIGFFATLSIMADHDPDYVAGAYLRMRHTKVPY